MIRSMTGFGRASFELLGSGFQIEARSVNHRHLDVRVRLPRLFADHENLAKSVVQGRLQRGKVDVTVSAGAAASSPGEVRVDVEVAAQYVAAAHRLSEATGVAGTLDVTSLLGMPGVTRVVEPELDEEVIVEALTEAIAAAMDALVEMRLAEGRALAVELEGRLARVEEMVDFFERRSGEVVAAAKQRLEKRMAQIQQETGLLDEARLHQEIVIAADRLDVTEELVRLRSHVQQFRRILGEAGESKSVGRRLDFLLQEMGREANTVGSKASDAPLAHEVVELKAELERIREQVQNVE